MHNLKVTVDTEAEDQLAVVVRKITIESPDKSDVKTQALAVVERINYLPGGELKVIEVDGPRNAVQIRSSKPVDGAFVEVILRDGNYLSLERRPSSLFLSKADYERLVIDLRGIFSRE